MEQTSPHRGTNNASSPSCGNGYHGNRTRTDFEADMNKKHSAIPGHSYLTMLLQNLFLSFIIVYIGENLQIQSIHIFRGLCHPLILILIIA